MIVTVFVSSGLTNAYRSVLSARGSWLISGASEWLEALASPGAGKRVRIAASASAPSASAAATTIGLEMRGRAACMGSVLLPPVGCRAWFAAPPRTVRLRVDARARAVLERVAEGGGGGDQRLVAGGADELDRRLDLRPHRAGREPGQERLGLVDGERAQLLLPVGAEVGEDGRHLGEDHETLRAERPGEQRGSAVLVDHGVDAREVLPAAGGGDAAAAAGDDDRPRGEQRPDRLQLDHLERLRRGHDPAPAAACVVDDLPAAVALQAARLLFVVERPDRLGRLS